MQRNMKVGKKSLTYTHEVNQFRSHATQFKEFFEYLQTHVATATECAVALNIYRPNACRYKRWLEASGRLWEIKKAPCKITGFKAAYLSANPALAPKHSIQPTLFDGVQEGADYGK